MITKNSRHIDKKTILAIIPARGGSKSIFRKNIRMVGGKPLIAWTILASLRSKHITKTIVSSEDDEILKISKRFGADILIRPGKYAKDSTPIPPVISDCLAQLDKQKEKFDVLILLQPTSPLRDFRDIDSAIELFLKEKATALISGYEPDKSPLKAFVINRKGLLEGLVDRAAPFMNRQQLPPAFYANGAIYIINVKNFLATKNLLTSKTIPFIMPLGKSIDIDSLEDIKKVTLEIKHKNVSKVK